MTSDEAHEIGVYVFGARWFNMNLSAKHTSDLLSLSTSDSRKITNIVLSTVLGSNLAAKTGGVWNITVNEKPVGQEVVDNIKRKIDSYKTNSVSQTERINNASSK